MCGIYFSTESRSSIDVATWTPVNKTLIGSPSLDTVTVFHYPIPDVIPNTAREFLLYASIYCGTSVSGSLDDIALYVIHNGMRLEKFLFMISYHQNAVNTNSDNMWFPLPADRLVHLEIPAAFPQNCAARLYTIGYR